MHCPTDGTVLQLAERHGIEIDYCPACRGVWLDRGELDKIIDRAAEGDRVRTPAPPPPAAPAPSAPPAPPRPAVYYDDDDDDHRHWGDHSGRHKRKRKKGFLNDLFDFDD